MIPFETMSVLPPPGDSPEGAIHRCLELLTTRLGAARRAAEHVLSLTFFVAAEEPTAFQKVRRAALDGTRELFGTASPPVSIVGQTPEEGRHAALEAAVLLDTGHAKGREITLETALDGLGIPLHPGAERYYREMDMLSGG